MALAYANPAGSAVLLGNLYTAVWEGHALCTFGVDLVTYLIRKGLWEVLGGGVENTFVSEIQIEKY